ncbi:hypothetical protein K435DRAFT_876729 [Dendrothele bispora CBS 962.96]|uniref:Uncharacterized protein n=1 Tax=Dendrothele bispora (strain CBS 962.96) TaxID=1314807 RepID=A0A4S8KSI5_DENBC|nr:hypothetical protein K435DRAFT_876729 [Dendrothele bispora CBS 962.96]
MSSPSTHVSETDLEEDPSYQQHMLRCLDIILSQQREIQASQSEFRTNQAFLLASVQTLQTLQTSFNEELHSLKDKIDQLYPSYPSIYESFLDGDTVSTQAILNSSPYRQILPSDVFPEGDEHLPLVMGPGPTFRSVATSTPVTPQRPCMSSATVTTPPLGEFNPMTSAGSVNSSTIIRTNLPEVMGPGPYIFSDTSCGHVTTQTEAEELNIPASAQAAIPRVDFSSPIRSESESVSDSDSLYRVTQRRGGLGIAMAYCNNATSEVYDSDN